jgi:pyridoxal phosphate enzyme (YggS family)
MSTIAAALQAVEQRIARAAIQARRNRGSIKLVAVSKGVSSAAVREAYNAGQQYFGESYLQEALAKIKALSDLAPEWHFVGPVQSNKTNSIASRFAWVHSVDRIKTAQRLSQARPAALGDLNVCVQVNISREVAKSGVAAEGLRELVEFVEELPRLKLRGLMAVPLDTDNVVVQRQQFGQLRQLLDKLNDSGLKLDTLSMGMSHDLEAAVAEGATILRVGTAIFGQRPETKRGTCSV